MAAGSIFPHWQLSIHLIVLQILFYWHHRLREKKWNLNVWIYLFLVLFVLVLLQVTKCCHRPEKLATEGWTELIFKFKDWAYTKSFLFFWNDISGTLEEISLHLAQKVHLEWRMNSRISKVKFRGTLQNMFFNITQEFLLQLWRHFAQGQLHVTSPSSEKILFSLLFNTKTQEWKDVNFAFSWQRHTILGWQFYKCTL